MKAFRLAKSLVLVCLVLQVNGWAQTTPGNIMSNTPVVATPSAQGLVASKFKTNTAAINEAAGQLKLQLPGTQQPLILRQKNFERRSANNFAWIGGAEAVANSSVVLTVRDGYLAGRIQTADGVYEIRPTGADESVVELQNPSNLAICGGTRLAPRGPKAVNEPAVNETHDALSTAALSVAPVGTALDPTLENVTTAVTDIAVMVVYTPQARAAAGGVAQMNAQAQAAVDNANAAFTNSLINIHYTLVYTGEVAHNDAANLNTDLTWVANDPTVASLRNQYNADLVSLFVENSGVVGSFGLSYQMTDPTDPYFADFAFTVLTRSSAVAQLTYAHEHGHNLGMDHDVANSAYGGATNYSYGHYVNGSFRTVMSSATGCTSGCARVAYFSNPNVSYAGKPTGVANAADNAATANQTAGLVSEFRIGTSGCTSNCTQGTAPNSPSSLLAQVVSGSQINLTWADNATNEEGFQIERSTDQVNYSLIASVTLNTVSYSVTGLTAGTQYAFRVRAVGATTGSYSSYSNVAVATTTSSAPAAPTNLASSSVTQTQAVIAWADNSTNETGFQVERSLNNSTWTLLTTTASNVVSYTNTGLTAGTIYYYRVRASNATGNSAYTTTLTVTTLPTAPAAPTNLALSSVSQTQAIIAWTDNSTNETGFQVERSLNGTTWAYYNTVSTNVAQFTDLPLTAATAYYYRVRAINGGGNSAYTGTLLVTTLPNAPAAPTNLAATAASATQVNLTWTDNATNEVNYYVERKTGTGAFAVIATLASNVASYADTTVAASTAYTYQVRAGNTGGYSTYTSQVAVTTPAATGALPAPWITSVVNLTSTGSASATSGVFTIKDKGKIASSADSFRYVYQTLTGDGEITLRINTLGTTATSARVGVMIRETLTAGSKMALMGTNGAKTFYWDRRATASAKLTSTSSGTGTTLWVRITRVGNVFTSFKSADGVTWTQVGTATITMASNAYIGFVTSSGSTSTVITSMFDNITCIP